MGNGHLPGPELSLGDEKYIFSVLTLEESTKEYCNKFSSNSQPALPAAYSNPDTVKKFVDWASQNGISVNGRASNHNMYPNQKSKSSAPPSDTTALVTDLNPWEDTRPPTSIGLPPIWEFKPLPSILDKPCDQVHPGLIHLPTFYTGSGIGLMHKRQTCWQKCARTLRIIKGWYWRTNMLLREIESSSYTNQLSQLAAFVKELNQAMDTMVTIPITSSTALGSIVQHLGFIIQEHNIQTSPVCAFAIYHLIAPPLKYLLLTLQWHEHLKIIPKILSPPQELSWFCKLIRSLCSQLTGEELAAALGLFTDFEMEQYLLDVTIQDPLTPPLSPTYTPSNTNSLEVEVTLTVEPMELPVLDTEAIHEAPVKSNLS
ncbi:hypothetical protein BS47DRAFT_1360459 [Hydnum rufescens UP504]|uniref:Uncharacterized protein n=1 Tax=Hydnum rufescens UP504 TaxID=1448309 RepID=A0A9P6DZ25_9AGAM|nr:hypothetical protein BS47DRAFT_1360459 [Hydnum rufescens UP504]